MSLSGDLATLELADLLQNLEIHRRSGVLRVESDDDAAHLYFDEGALALFARDERASLMDVLVASGTIGEEALESAVRKRRRTRKSLGEVLVAAGAVDADTLRAVAESRLLDEACELVAAKRGRFAFQAGSVPRGVFDPEERRLGLRLPAGPLLMESARREDHWQLIRQRVPSDGMHFVAQGKPRKLEQSQAQLAEALLPLLDGSAAVREVVAAFPHRRFELYQLLSDLVDQRAVRAAGPDEWLELVREARQVDPERAQRLLDRALAANPHHLELLSEQVDVAQDLDRLEAAVDALKMVVHLAFEAQDGPRARAELQRARELVPEDGAFLERSVELALEEERDEDARRDGLELVGQWRKPGLHTKAQGLLERLHARLPEDVEVLFELARSHADCGAPARGVGLLMDRAQRCLQSQDDDGARHALDALLRLEPQHAGALEQVAALDSGAFVRRRARRTRRRRQLVLAGALALAAAGFGYECLARGALVEANSAVARERMIEEARYDEAAERYAAVVRRFPWSLTSRWNARRHLADLELKGGRPSSAR